MKMLSFIQKNSPSVFIASLGALINWVHLACAQPLQPEVLFSFTHNSAIEHPYGALVQGSDGNLYGTSGGGDFGYGTVFKITTNGVLTTLVSFADTNGAYLDSGLTRGSDGNFYGITFGGGAYTNLYGAGFGTVFRVTAKGELTTLASFAGTNGANPSCLILASDGTLYGATSSGGRTGSGTVFQLTTNGVLASLVSFAGANGASPNSLILGSDGNFYGTTDFGGAYTNQDGDSFGTVFRVTKSGELTTLVSFDWNNGSDPHGLTLGSDGNFYGTTADGGSERAGTVFRVTTAGRLATLYSFVGADGSSPVAPLTLGSDGNFYGTTALGGDGDFGTVFRMTTSGALTTLASFAGINGMYPQRLTLGSDGNFYGTTPDGGGSELGTVFRVTTSGVLTTLVSLTGNYTNGAAPVAALMLSTDGNFYGTASRGGNGDAGTVFRMTTNGVITTLASFARTNGAYPDAPLIEGNDGFLYGTTSGGGSTYYSGTSVSGDGTAFRVTTNGALATLHSFGTIWDINGNPVDGLYPATSLTLGRDGNFYGTTDAGGAPFWAWGGFYGYGTAFELTSNGVLTPLVSFNSDAAYPNALTLGSDGSLYGTAAGSYNAYGGPDSLGAVFRLTTSGLLTTYPLPTITDDYGDLLGVVGSAAGLALGSDGNFYGTTYDGGDVFLGTVFRVTTNGLLTTLVSFAGTNGADPSAALTVGTDGNFYGTTAGGGCYNSGTVFQVTSNGVLTTLISFAGTNGANPGAAVTLGPDGDFYGTTASGGPDGVGVIYRLRHGVSIQSFGMKTNGFALNTLNVGGSAWVVLESSSDLSTWTPIQTNGTAAAQQFLDPTALTQPRQFYRVRQQ